MNNIIEALITKEDLLCGRCVNKTQIQQAEDMLGIKFSEDYRAYLLAYGVVAYEGHELTGITKSKRLNVIDCTLKYRELNRDCQNMYVVEVTNYDGIIFWQSPEGTVYKSFQDGTLIKAYDSLIDYVCNF